MRRGDEAEAVGRLRTVAAALDEAREVYARNGEEIPMSVYPEGFDDWPLARRNEYFAAEARRHRERKGTAGQLVARRRTPFGVPADEKALMALAFVLPLVSRVVAGAFGLPLAPLTIAALLLLISRRGLALRAFEASTRRRRNGPIRRER